MQGHLRHRTGTFNDGRRLSVNILNKDSAHNQSQTSRTSSRKQFHRNTPPSIQQKTKIKKVVFIKLIFLIFFLFIYL
jgi:hypothetical protein